MKRALWLFLGLAILSVVGACTVTLDSGNEAATKLILTGTITVPVTDYWTDIKVGFFATPTNNDGSYAYDLWVLNSGINSNKVYLNHNADYSNIEFTPTYSGTISGTGLSKTYSITIPTWDNSKKFLFLVWYDKDGDGKMDLIDYSSTTVSNVNSEYNALSWKTFKTTNQQIQSVYAAKDTSSINVFKYDGVSTSGTYYLSQVIGTDTAGFNFTVNTNSWITN